MAKKDCFSCKFIGCGGYQHYFCELNDDEPVYSGRQCGNYEERR